MKSTSIPLLIGLLSVALSCVSAGQARAILGEPAASVESDSTALSAVRRSATSHTGYTVQEIVSDAVTIREYVSPGGIVFGVAWNGLTHPDLEPLLGVYHAEYRQARQQTPRQHGRRFLQVRAARVVVEMAGHMRDLRGRAYLPALVPKGMDIDEIR